MLVTFSQNRSQQKLIRIGNALIDTARNVFDAALVISNGRHEINTEAKRCFATHDEDIDYFNMRIYIILIACVYIQQFNFVQ